MTPPNVEQVWNPEGIKVLGTPVGTDQFVSDIVPERVQEETRLWEAIEWVPDLQVAWQILVQCAGPRCHHLLRTLPPSQSSEYSLVHDVGMLRAMKSLLGGLPGEPQEREDACRFATLPIKMGGLGLGSATWMVPAAIWASLADSANGAREASRFVSVNCDPCGSKTCWLLWRFACGWKHVGQTWVRGATSMVSVAGGHATTSRHYR